MARLIFIIFFIFCGIFLSGREKPARSRPITWSHDIGLMIGGAYYLGELNQGKHFNMSQPAAGVFYRFNQNHRVAYRAGFNYGNILGDDSQSDDEDQIMRNLNFRNRLMEFHAIAEFNFWNYRISHPKRIFAPYVFLGFAALKHNPMTEYEGKYVELHPLSTEGQGTSLDPDRKKQYKLMQFTIPFGIGAKLNLARNVGLSFEWGLRKTFTDYLDDVSKQYVNPALLAQEKGPLAAILSDRSLNNDNFFNMVGTQRGNPYIKDWYNFFGFQVSIQVHGKPKPCNAYKGATKK